MSRNISSPMLSAITSAYVRPALAAQIAFKSQTSYVWSGSGNLVYSGNTYTGIGDFGKLGDIVEGQDVQAYSTSVTLSGIDQTLLSESITDIQLGAPATIYLVLLDGNGVIIGTPYPLFVGTVDKPSISIGTETLSITLNLETKLANLQRPSMRRYTSVDQRIDYPADTFFDNVESLNDQALIWK